MTHRFPLRALALSITAMAAGLPGMASAESNFVTGTGTLTATARVDFQITIPKILFLQVGTGTMFANNTAVNLIDFTVPAANVGNGTAVAASATSGDLGNGVVTAIVRGNNGNINLVATNGGALNNGGTDTIPWSQITTTPSALAGYATQLTPPTLANTTSAPVTLTAVNKIVDQGARWTYSYANGAIVPPGTYGGVNTNNGRVTYTATLP
jgi:hypothetical protein